MSKLYSHDLRERVAAFALAKGSTNLAAQTFSVSKATAVRWAKQLRDTGNVAIGDVGGHRRVILRHERDWLAARITAEPHVSLRELLSELEARGIIVSYGAFVELRAPPRPELQKKQLTPPNSKGLLSPGGDTGGRNTRHGLTRRVWSS